MQIKIFVVLTEIEKLNDKALNYGIDNTKTAKNILEIVNAKNTIMEQLEFQKRELIRLFKGLTITPNQIGYWYNEKGLIETDKVETWNIYVDKALTEKLEYETVLNQKTEIAFQYLLFQIKQITQQKTLAYAIDNEIFFR